ncbi:MAG: hypothetical protein Q7R41_12305 [Phycisphaerales bacterium]|nr:hypothetical protein [Phycisphaerales bacterium]
MNRAIGSQVSLRAGIFDVVDVADALDGTLGPYAKLRHLDGSLRPDFWIPWLEIERDGPTAPEPMIDAPAGTTVSPESDEAAEQGRALTFDGRRRNFFTKKEQP